MLASVISNKWHKEFILISNIQNTMVIIFFLASMHNFIETYKKQKIIYQFLLVKTVFIFHGIGTERMTGYFLNMSLNLML